MSCTRLSKYCLEVDNGLNRSEEFDIRKGISIETTMSGKQKVSVVITSNGKVFKVPVETVGAATKFREVLEAMLREIDVA